MHSFFIVFFPEKSLKTEVYIVFSTVLRWLHIISIRPASLSLQRKIIPLHDCTTTMLYCGCSVFRLICNFRMFSQQDSLLVHFIFWTKADLFVSLFNGVYFHIVLFCKGTSIFKQSMQVTITCMVLIWQKWRGTEHRKNKLCKFFLLHFSCSHLCCYCNYNAILKVKTSSYNACFAMG